MRIIDKNTDFYDYCQQVYKDDLVTFDRRDSYNLTKGEFARKFKVECVYGKYKVAEKTSFEATKFIMLQVCNTFWLFKMNITEVDNLPFKINYATDYSMELVAQWKDYDLPSVAIELSHIQFRLGVFSWRELPITDKIVEAMKLAIHTNDLLKPKTVFNNFTVAVGDKVESRHIPLLRDIGIASLVNPEDIYFALDEYFSKKRTEGERIESVGITDKERAVNHGFDERTSFRGKIK